MTTTEPTETMRTWLPAALRDLPIARVSAGLSGAGVYKLGDAHVVKISADGDFAQKLAILRAAAAAEVAPEVVHADAEHRAVITAFVQDQGFAALAVRDRPRALALAGACLRRVRALDVPAPRAEPRAFLARVLAATAGFPMPAAARATAEAVLALPEPPTQDAFAHGDANPTNIVFDGERVLFLDWDMAAYNSASYDAATIAMFLRLPEPGPLCEATPRFAYDKRLVAAMCGMIFLHLARTQGHAGGAGSYALADLYAALRAGALDLAGAEGKWRMGLALLAEAA